MKKAFIWKTLEMIADPAFFVDTDLKIRYANKGFHKEFGHAAGEHYISFLFKNGYSEKDPKHVIRSKFGHLFHLDFLPLKNNGITGQLGILRDISELKRLEGYIQYLEELNKGLNRINHEQQSLIEKLSHQALTDGLTGLYNYRHFWERADAELKRANRYSESLSCLMIDIDNFKRINDRFDHQFGDLILKKISIIIRAPLRATDILARYGGDEFSILLPNTDYEGTQVISKKIMERVRRFQFEARGSSSARVTISLGVSSYPVDKIVDSTQLVEYADAALYEAKARGKDRICFFSEMKPVLH